MSTRDWRTLRHLGRDRMVPLAVAERVADERDRLHSLLVKADAEIRSHRAALASRSEEAHRLQHAVDVLSRQQEAAGARIEQLEAALVRAGTGTPDPKLLDQLDQLRTDAAGYREDAQRGWAEAELARREAEQAREEADAARAESQALREERDTQVTPVRSASTEELEHEVAQWRQRAQSYVADLANVRRREAEDIAAGVRKERVARLASLATVHDTVVRSLETSTLGADDPWTVGTQRTRDLILQEMAKAGATPMGTAGEPFDPNLHEAVAAVPGGAPDTIAQVFEIGFVLDDGTLVRPARVGVFGGH